MLSDPIVPPVLLVNEPPIVGISVPLRSSPNARSVLAAAPYLYTSPVVEAPVSTAYCSLSRAPPPPSVIYQPTGSVVLVVLPAVLERVLKSWVNAVPVELNETLPTPVACGVGATALTKPCVVACESEGSRPLEMVACPRSLDGPPSFRKPSVNCC